ncbi:restriction endonuclease subunit S [Thiolapillus sp.]
MGGKWLKTTVGEFCPLTYGKNLPEKRRKQGTYQVYGSNGPVGFHNKPLVKGEGIVIGRKGTVGAIHYVALPFWSIDTTFYVTNSEDRDLRFTYYLLESLGLEHMNTDSAVPGLNRDAAHARKILVPGLYEQRAIAHILGSLDDKIELNRQMAQTLESIARAIFKSWFVDFDPVVVNALRAGNSIPDKFTKRAARYRDNPDELSLSEEIQCQFPDRFQDSELGPIPERWEIGPLKQIASLSTKTIQPKNDPLKLWVHYSIPAYDDGKMPKTEQGQTIMSGKYLVPKHAVLASKLNPQFPRVWLPMQDGIEDSICSTEFMPFIPRDSDERNLLYMFFLSDVAQREITNRVTGSTGSRQRVRPKDIEQMNILIPEKRLRIIYSDLTNGLIGLSLEKQDESATLANIRDTLLPKLISGELRIKDFERFLGKVA